MFEKIPGSGTWWIRYADARGCIRREKVGSLEAAEARLKIRREEAKIGIMPLLARQRRAVPFKKIADDALVYADDHKRSAKVDHSRMKKLKEWFGERPANSITAKEIECHFELEKSWEAGTWNRYRSLLSLTYRLAIRAGEVKENPARQSRHRTESSGRVRFLLPKEEVKLRKVIREKFPQREPELDLALNTGLRLSEQYGARWDDVDFERRVFTVPLDKGGQTSHVPLNAAALKALRDLYRQHGKSGFVCGGRCSSRSWFEDAVNAAKIKGFTWHCLRHTFASRLVMSGADLRTVAELLRDKTLAMVMRYAHVAPDYKLAAVERMGSSFGVSVSTKLTPAVEAQKSASTMVQ
ncbi:MAG: site-specific integrase [Acidobacteriia bacterium]|nr:site-specific integrase [Terriglobia bacterium]